MPRISPHRLDTDDLDELQAPPPPPRRRRPPAIAGPRLVKEGSSGRRAVDLDDEPSAGSDQPAGDPAVPPGPDSPATLPSRPDPSPLSSYDVAVHGPGPVPDWLVTELAARDTRLGVLKTGKEADVGLLDRSVPGGPGCLLAVKTYRDARHRMFHRDSGYQEGRRTRRSRESRALSQRTRFGRELLAGTWAAAEFDALSRLYRAGARVPYPVQLIGVELMMEFVGQPDGTAAPRLAAYDAAPAELAELWHGLVADLEKLAEEGLTHGDLSAYNVLVHEDRCVLIDLPQVVDVVANPQGQAYLERDCATIADFFARRGVAAADGELLALHLGSIARAG